MVENLRQLRRKKGVTQQALADAAGTTQQNINKYENHGIEPDIYTLKVLADYFDTTIDYLVGRERPAQNGDTTTPYALNLDESTLIEQYRMLSPKERESIRLVMDNYLNP